MKLRYIISHLIIYNLFLKLTFFKYIFIFFLQSEPEDEDSDTAPSNNWSVLRQDFMQSANLKDWDKED